MEKEEKYLIIEIRNDLDNAICRIDSNMPEFIIAAHLEKIKHDLLSGKIKLSELSPSADGQENVTRTDVN